MKENSNMNIKAELTEEEALQIVNQNGHTMKPMKPQGSLRLQQCSKNGCHSLLFIDTEHNLVYGSAITHVCQDYRATNGIHSLSTKTPHKHIKIDKHDYSYLEDKEWGYDSGITKRVCLACKKPLYRVFKIKKGKRYVGLFCEQCSAIYNVGLNSFCHTRLKLSEKCDSIGEKV